MCRVRACNLSRMRIARIAHPEGMCFALVEGEDDGVQLHEIEGHPFGEVTKTGRSWPLADVRLLAPMLPSKVVAIGRNYADHVKEVFKTSGESLPPTMFLKPPTAVIGPEAPIRIPEFATKVEFEGELAIVIGKPCKNVKAADAESVIFGYTIVNDWSARDLQATDVDFDIGQDRGVGVHGLLWNVPELGIAAQGDETARRATHVDVVVEIIERTPIDVDTRRL